MKIKCKICGKEFEAKQSNYNLCSDDCRRINTRNTAKRYQQHYKYTSAYKNNVIRQREKRKKKHKCPVCGRQLAHHKHSNVPCDMCYIKKLSETTDKQEQNHIKSILHCRGYDRTMINYELNNVVS